ncbi:NRDE-2, necessary for RNA interference-domain-containing protein [Pisolithus albus]|nr:NRDE-2, necessary for RNA interference-domain-containing protein [Pisolithus albus]
MSAPSFPSFTPSFSSFPDLPDPGPSKRTTSSDPASVQRDHPDEAYQRNKIDRSNWRDRKVDKEKKSGREKHIPHHPETTRHSSWVKDIVFHDERNKQDEDRRLAVQDHSQWSFFSDRKGDPLNITYGGIHAGDLPKYRPVNQGRYILGLVGNWTVSRKSGKGIEIMLGGKRKQLGLTDSGAKALLNAPARRLTVSASSYRYEEVNGFLPLPSRVGRVAGGIHGPLQDEADTDSESSEGQEDNSDEDEGPLSLPSEQLAIKDLEQKIVLQPSSVETWLCLVTRSLATVPPTSKNASTVRAEITLSILDRALTAHPANRTSRRLRLMYLRAGEEVWYESKLQVEWEEALKLGGVEIWLEWLEWRIRKSTESIDSVVTDAMRALQALGGSPDSEVERLRVVWRVAVVFQEAGFYERATALFQAQAELTFEVPQSLYGLPIETQLEALEEFWESEVPRVGEVGAKGWSAWTSSGPPEMSASGEESIKMDVDIKPSKDPFSSWYNDEVRADRLLRTPTRSTTERAVSDPYSTVLFSDIRPLLLSLTTQRAKSFFRLMWLALLGLHIPGFSRSLAGDAWDRWSYTFFTSPACLSSIFPEGGFARQYLADSYSGILIGKEREYSSAFGPIKEWSLNVFGPLEWVGKDQWRMWTARSVEGANWEFARAIFSQLRCGTEDHEWDIYALAFEAAVSVKQALKLSRSFLSTARESLAHWAAHARLERLRGRIEDARKVYQTVLIAVRRPPTHGFVGQLWWDWAEMEWLSGDQEVALRVVMRAGNVDGSGGMMVLRAKRNLEDIINASHERWKDREAWIKLRAVIELLVASSPASALAIFDTQPASGFRTSAEQQESLTVASLLMLYDHSSTLRNPTPPTILRDRLQVALETYPSNTIILGMFLEAEKGYGLWGRVRNQLSQVNKEKDIARRVTEVWVAGWEKGRWEREIERTRAGLFAAAESDRTKNSSIIWRIIMEFEIRAGQMQRAKDLLYRAVSECPLSKELYLLAFGPLRHVFKPHELHGFVEVMADRGLRMRRSLEEYTRNYREVRESDDLTGNPEASDDEIERDARERRRLMPY